MRPSSQGMGLAGGEKGRTEFKVHSGINVGWMLILSKRLRSSVKQDACSWSHTEGAGMAAGGVLLTGWGRVPHTWHITENTLGIPASKGSEMASVCRAWGTLGVIPV